MNRLIFPWAVLLLVALDRDPLLAQRQVAVEKFDIAPVWPEARSDGTSRGSGGRGASGADAAMPSAKSHGVSSDPLRLLPSAPPLPPPSGRTVRVDSVEKLVRAADQARAGDTILLADGQYSLPRYFDLHADRVTLRGESGDPRRVVLDGSRSNHGELVGVSAGIFDPTSAPTSL